MGKTVTAPTNGEAGRAVIQTQPAPDDGSWDGDILAELAQAKADAERERMRRYVSLRDTAKALDRNYSNILKVAKKLSIPRTKLRGRTGQLEVFFEKTEALRLARLLGGEQG